MLLMDGSIDDVNTFVRYGFEQAVLAGDVPETIMIGIPQTNGTEVRVPAVSLRDELMTSSNNNSTSWC